MSDDDPDPEEIGPDPEEIGPDPENVEPHSIICAVIENDPRAWVPMADYEAIRGRMNRFHGALCEIAGVLDKLADSDPT